MNTDVPWQRCWRFRLPWIALAVVVAASLLIAAAPQRALAAGLAIDGSVKTHQSNAANTITSGALSTANANDLVLAFLTSDGPGTGAQSFSSVTGGGLTWKLVKRTNAQAGTAEIWEATASSALSNITVTATRSTGAYVGSIDVVAFSGADTTTTGATGSAAAASGAPSVSLTTTAAGSWVWGVGDDYDNAITRTPGSGQTVFDQFLASVGDTYWVQSQTAPGGSAGTTVTLNDTAPTTDRYDYASIEIRPGVLDTVAPSAPGNLSAPSVTSNSVSLSWSPSPDNVAVAGYDILRDGSVVGNSTATSFPDATVSPSTSYQYTVEAYDAAGNVSAPSNAISVSTPAASTSPPVISQITSSAITSTPRRSPGRPTSRQAPRSCTGPPRAMDRTRRPTRRR